MAKSLRDFYAVPTTPRESSAGPVDMPIKYFDSTMIAAFYPIAPEAAEPILAAKGVKPVRMIGGKAMASITWFEYRDTSIGRYNELSIAVFSYYGEKQPAATLLQMLRGKKPIGVHIIHLPVTTKIAWSAGCEFWGYPKIVAELPYERSGGRLEAALIDGGKPVFNMSIPYGKGMELGMPDLITLSGHEGKVIKTRIETSARVLFGKDRGTALTIEDGSHPIAQTLQALQLPKKASFVLTAEPFRTILPEGVVVGSYDESA